MKKVLIVIVLFMAVLAVNAQATKTTDTKEKGVRTPVMVADLQQPRLYYLIVTFLNHKCQLKNVRIM